MAPSSLPEEACIIWGKSGHASVPAHASELAVVGHAVEAEDDGALLRLLDRRCAELQAQRQLDLGEIQDLSSQCVELQRDLDACLDTLELERQVHALWCHICMLQPFLPSGPTWTKYVRAVCQPHRCLALELLATFAGLS